MTKFLISTMPATGHINPAIPLVTELVGRGHQVAWHTGLKYRATVETTGAQFVPFAQTPDFEVIPVVPDPGTKGLAAAISVNRRLFIDRMAGQVADYEDILKTFPADVVIADLCSLGAATLHDRGGPVFATLGINPLVTLDPEIPPFGSGRPPATTAMGRTRNSIAHWMARHLFLNKVTNHLNTERAALGLAPLPSGATYADRLRSPFLHLMPTTPAFEYPRRRLERQVHFVGPLLPSPQAGYQRPSWWKDLDTKPVVHVTQGTYATDAVNLIRPTLDALADLDVLVLATTAQPDAIGAIPDNTRVERFIPHDILLPHVDVMITNAGYNGVLAALAHGVPLVCAGLSEDKGNVAARVSWSGSGIDLRTDTPSATQVREGTESVLDNSSYRDNARRIQTDFARHHPAVEAADLLERLASTKEPV